MFLCIYSTSIVNITHNESPKMRATVIMLPAVSSVTRMIELEPQNIKKRRLSLFIYDRCQDGFKEYCVRIYPRHVLIVLCVRSLFSASMLAHHVLISIFISSVIYTHTKRTYLSTGATTLSRIQASI